MLRLPDPVRGAVRRGGAGLAVLVVRLGAFGDILRTLPAVRCVRRALPDAHIAWVCDEAWAPSIADHPDLDDVVPYPRGRIREAAACSRTWARLVDPVLELRGRLRTPVRDGARRGLALDFHGNLRSGVVTRLSGYAVRVGYAGHQQKEGNRWLTTHRVPSGDRRTPRTERNFSLVSAIGVAVEPTPSAGLPIPAETARRAAEIALEAFGSDVDYGVISPGASVRQIYKRPPATLLAAGARAMRARGTEALVVYGPGEEADARAAVAAADGAATLAPPTTLPELRALLARARVFLGGDTGPLHLACAVGCPVAAVYGPTDPRVNAPWGVPHRTIRPEGRTYTGIKRLDREAGGFDGIDPRSVERAVAELLDSSSAPGLVDRE